MGEKESAKRYYVFPGFNLKGMTNKPQAWSEVKINTFNLIADSIPSNEALADDSNDDMTSAMYIIVFHTESMLPCIVMISRCKHVSKIIQGNILPCIAQCLYTSYIHLSWNIRDIARKQGGQLPPTRCEDFLRPSELNLICAPAKKSLNMKMYT